MLAVPGGSALSWSTAMLGISFSLVPAVLWPAVARYASAEQLGTAFGLLTAVQQAGVFVVNIVAGYINDGSAASAANPGGYDPMLWLFGGLGAVAFVCAFLLYVRSVRDPA
jgi:hypothetical protein